jgi:hypothetical protein
MAYLEKFGFLNLREPSPTVGLALERMEATEVHSVRYRAARHEERPMAPELAVEGNFKD